MSNYESLITELEKLTLPEAAELVKVLEERWGVSAAAPVMMGAMPAMGAAAAEAVEEKTEFNVVLEAIGTQKVQVIKAVREVNPDLGLKEAKEVVEAAPTAVLEGVSKEDAANARQVLEEAGAKVAIQ
jgi:large subunit ribosomal protein L7/L12